MSSKDLDPTGLPEYDDVTERGVIVGDDGLPRWAGLPSTSASTKERPLPTSVPRFVVRVPLKTETDAFRVAMALAVVGGTSILVGWLTSRAYGVVLFAAGVVAGVIFELAGREIDRGSALQEAASGPHPHGASGEERHILVVASVTLAGDELAGELAARGEGRVELDVLAPILASRSHYWASDVDREREEARRRLQASLAWAAEHGIPAKGEVGDPDALAAIEDELRDFGADEVVIATHPGERTSWLAGHMLAHLRRELDVPVREIVVGDDRQRSPIAPGSPAK
ncbi:hypothetical protein [Capillimicrobium parvum]|uniref:Universal stress protein n=1 Tax=Capillimicrobium parvum TaxID=2884022 RepID=A0A9E6XZ83_9ACTN|nr:hypothetical protein [Capillimicrobium parvum]UGS37061.1 hypothetical protein DSM104329_03473 [Capillimicrobium parvum]